LYNHEKLRETIEKARDDKIKDTKDNTTKKERYI